MTSRARLRAVLASHTLAVFATAMLARPTPALACATAPPEGATVRLADEATIIVWDEATKTEHFIRRAVFHSTAPSFGFLVPTPSVPQLAEAPEAAFGRLEQLLQPKIERTSKFDGFAPASCAGAFLLGALGGRAAPGAAGASAVRELSSQKVAGLDATVLEADRPEALTAWLGKRGFAATPELEAWVAPYVAAHWKITAFRYERAAENAVDGAYPYVEPAAVRLSFTTERPIYPYREPRRARASTHEGAPYEPERLLRVFFFGPERADASVDGSGPWVAETAYAAPFDLATLGDTNLGVPLGKWLTIFDDRTTTRPFADLTFARSTDGAPVYPPPYIHVDRWRFPIPVEPIVLLAGAAGYFAYRRRKRRQAA